MRKGIEFKIFSWYDCLTIEF